MIPISSLLESDKGRHVIFTHHHGATETGWLSSWNDKYIFVRFTLGSTAAGCDPSQLRWEFSTDAEKVDG